MGGQDDGDRRFVRICRETRCGRDDFRLCRAGQQANTRSHLRSESDQAEQVFPRPFRHGNNGAGGIKGDPANARAIHPGLDQRFGGTCAILYDGVAQDRRHIGDE